MGDDDSSAICVPTAFPTSSSSCCERRDCERVLIDGRCRRTTAYDRHTRSRPTCWIAASRRRRRIRTGASTLRICGPPTGGCCRRGARSLLAGSGRPVRVGNDGRAAGVRRADDGRVAPWSTPEISRIRTMRAYGSEQFQWPLHALGISCSMSRSGYVWDNAVMELFISADRAKDVCDA
jgi:hypothetical protein